MNFIPLRSQQDIHAFHQLPFSIYRNDPHWIPHIQQEVEGLFTKGKNPYLGHGEAERWVARDLQGNVLGRIAAFIDFQTCHTYPQATGGMGFFECIPDQALAFQLLDLAKAWLQERGMEAMDGPINFGPRDKFWGLITQNFRERPYYGQNYNPPYYKAFFQAYGFIPYFHQYIYHREVDQPLEGLFKKRAKRILSSDAYQFTSFKKKDSRKFAQDFIQIYNLAWQNHDNFHPMSIEQGMTLVEQLSPILDPDIMWFAYYKGRAIGFMVMVPDVNLWFKRARGNLNMVGKLRFLWAKYTEKNERMVGLAFGVIPDFQGKGLEGALFKALQDRIFINNRYKEVLISWIGDFNPKMIRIIEALGATKVRTMTTYRKVFADGHKGERAPIIR